MATGIFDLPSFHKLRTATLHVCAPTRIRTWDRLLKRELLYQLSYRGVCKVILLKSTSKRNRHFGGSRPRLKCSPPLAFGLGTASQKFSAENFCSGVRLHLQKQHFFLPVFEGTQSTRIRAAARSRPLTRPPRVLQIREERSVPSEGVEPPNRASKARVLSIRLRGRMTIATTAAVRGLSVSACRFSMVQSMA